MINNNIWEAKLDGKRCNLYVFTINVNFVVSVSKCTMHFVKNRDLFMGAKKVMNDEIYLPTHSG